MLVLLAEFGCYFRKLQQHTVKKNWMYLFFRRRRFFYLFIGKSKLLYGAKIYATQSSEKIILLFNLKECYQSYTQEPLIYNVYRLLWYCLIFIVNMNSRIPLFYEITISLSVPSSFTEYLLRLLPDLF